MDTQTAYDIIIKNAPALRNSNIGLRFDTSTLNDDQCNYIRLLGGVFTSDAEGNFVLFPYKDLSIKKHSDSYTRIKTYSESLEERITDLQNRVKQLESLTSAQSNP